MKSASLIITFIAFLHPSFTQTGNKVFLQDCYENAIKTHPLNAKEALLIQDQQIVLERLGNSRRPSLDWNTQASIQTETIDLPFEGPGIPSLDLPLYRFQSTLDAAYTIYDGGMVEAKKNLESNKLQSEQKAVQVSLEQLKPKINQLYFGILLQKKKVAILENSLSNLHNRIVMMEAGVRHGAILESELKKLKVEALKITSAIEETKGRIKSLLASLASLTGIEMDETTSLQAPSLDNFAFSNQISRPELELFQLQKAQILANESLITAANKPKVGAFIQAGVGYPNPLNFFEDKLSPFAMAGVKLSWKILDWKQSERDRQLLSVQTQIVDNQRTIFEKNINDQEGQFQEDVKALNNLIVRDQEINQLQKEILTHLEAQLERGVITSAEYLDQVNAEIQAQLNLETHVLQLQKVKVNYLTLKGKL